MYTGAFGEPNLKFQISSYIYLCSMIFYDVLCSIRENSVTERFNSRFLRDYHVARPIDL